MTDRVATVPDGTRGPVRRRTHAGDGAELAVVEVGHPHALALVVAHGAGSSARFVVAAFADAADAAGLRLVTYDARGHGASSPARDVAGHHLDVHAGDLAAVASSTDGEVAVVGGVSLGAHAAVRAAASGSVDAPAVLACLPAWTGQAQRGVGPHAAVAAELRRTGVDAMIERIRHDATLPAWLRSTLTTDYARHDRASLAAALIALDGGVAPDEAEVARVEVPLVVVGWPDDPGHPLEVAARWAQVASSGTLGRLHLGDLEGDVGALGRAVVGTLLRSAARLGR